MTGPTPSPSGEPGAQDPEEAVVSPGFACNEQRERWVELRGENLSPVVIDALADSSDVSFPEITLERVADMTGADAEGASVTLTAEDAGDRRLVWIDNGLMRVRIGPDLELEPGVYDVTFTNSSGEEATAERALGIAGRPQVSSTQGEPVCVDQGEQAFTVEGSNFLASEEALPAVQIGEDTIVADSVGGCEELAAPFGPYRRCTSLTVTLPQGSFRAGAITVAVENPGPAACVSDFEADESAIAAVGPPRTFAVEPHALCAEQIDYDEVHVRGANFVRLSGDDAASRPTVTVSGESFQVSRMEGCEAIGLGVGEEVRRCTDLFFAVSAGTFEPGRQDVVVTNPGSASCASTELAFFTTVAPPSVASVEPNPITSEQGYDVVSVLGERFAVVGESLPEVTIGMNTYQPMLARGCEPLADSNLRVNLCDELVVEIAEGDLAMVDQFGASVVNPEPLSCATAENVTLTNISPPQLDSIAPQPICSTSGDNVQTLTGARFLDIDGALPTVEVAGRVYSADSVGGVCEPIEVQGASVQSCDELTVTLTGSDLDPGEYPVTVQNPAPARGTTTDEVSLSVFAAPRIDWLEPELVCAQTDARSITAHGQNFYIVDGSDPIVEIGQMTYAATSVDDCETVDGFPMTVERCTMVTFEVGAGDLPAGAAEVDIVAQFPASCGAARTRDLFLEDLPTLTSVEPDVATCDRPLYRRVVVTGTNFLSVFENLPTVTIGGMDYQAIAAQGCTAIDGLSHTTAQRCTELVVYVETAVLTAGDAVTVTNPPPSGCASAAAATYNDTCP